MRSEALRHVNDHTPSPWVSEEADPDSPTSVFYIYHEIPIALTRTRIAIVNAGPEADDNARLIAAAPDLLAACMKALNWHLRPCETEVQRRNVMDALSRAIFTAAG